MKKLYLLKRDHHDGQSINGVFESKELAKQKIQYLIENCYPNLTVQDYMIFEIELNQLVDIEAHEEEVFVIKE